MIISRNLESNIVSQQLLEILHRIHLNGPTSQEDFETMAYIKKFYPEEFSKYEKKILYTIGLFYKVGEPDGIFELAYSTIRDAIKKETSYDYTPVQAKEYKRILQHKYYSFSAPTSTGKSYLFQDLIKTEKRDVVIILPSRALIAEYLYKIQEIVPNDVLVLQFVENINIKHIRKRVYILTPERSDDLFTYKNQLNVGLILFDEAQIAEEEIRGLKFDALVRKTIVSFPDAKKVFAHPFVSNPEAQLQRNLITENAAYGVFMQNAVGKIYLTRKPNGEYETFSPFDLTHTGFSFNDVVGEVLNNGGSVLFYVSKSTLYSEDFEDRYEKYIKQCDKVENGEALRIIETLHQYIGDSDRGEKKSRLISLMKRGIVVHHGSMPLRIRLLIEEFVNLKCAKLCFATSTLIQGINMPFDVVVIDNFRFQGSESKKILDLKNLIGRAGRTTKVKDKFDFGYVVIPSRYKEIFSNRLCGNALLSEESQLNANIDDVNEDDKDIVEAIQHNLFDYDLRITVSQKSRIESSDVFTNVAAVLDKLVKNTGNIITAEEYYQINNQDRNKLKLNFARIYTVHLRRQTLTRIEKTILSTAIPIILWRVQGKSFKEMVYLRHRYITRKSDKDALKAQMRANLISEEEYNEQLKNLKMKFSQVATSLPNPNARRIALFEDNTKFDYDTLIYDTYDYLDKVIGQSLTDPICAVLKLYANSTNDDRANILANYIRFGTNEEKIIWLMKYGFTLEDMEWLIPCINFVDQNEIQFNPEVEKLDISKMKLIKRYLYI